jgi:uncharacterized cupredoxin-like copper-binding protein
MTLTGSPVGNGVNVAGRSVSAALVVAVMVLGGVACSSDDAATGSDDAAIDVLLSEWVLEPDPTLTDGGEVTFTGDNQGGVVHELVVVRGESASDLPAEGEGPGNYAVIESELPAGAVVGEIEDIAPGSSKDLTLDLDAGSYVLFCNLVGSASEGPEMEGRSHFAEGMYAEFTVN